MDYEKGLNQLKKTEDEILQRLGTRKLSKIDNLIQQVLYKNTDLNEDFYNLVQEYMFQYVEVESGMYKHPELQKEFNKIRGW